MKLLSKGDLMEIVLSEEECRNHDTAIPFQCLGLAESKFKECSLKFDPSLYVTDCSTSTYKLVNLAERLVQSGKLAEILDELSALKYKNKQLEKKLNVINKHEKELDQV